MWPNIHLAVALRCIVLRKRFVDNIHATTVKALMDNGKLPEVVNGKGKWPGLQNY